MLYDHRANVVAAYNLRIYVAYFYLFKIGSLPRCSLWKYMNLCAACYTKWVIKQVSLLLRFFVRRNKPFYVGYFMIFYCICWHQLNKYDYTVGTPHGAAGTASWIHAWNCSCAGNKFEVHLHFEIYTWCNTPIRIFMAYSMYIDRCSLVLKYYGCMNGCFLVTYIYSWYKELLITQMMVGSFSSSAASRL